MKSSGLSGKIASNVSEKINNISKNQVIAITHSPQVASIQTLENWENH